MNVWAEAFRKPGPALVVNYEQLHGRPHDTLQRAMQFFLGMEVDAELIQRAVEFASFDNMRKMEAGAHFIKTDRLRANDPKDPTSFKTREGKIGSYVKHLSADDIRYVERRIANTLHPSMGYRNPGEPPATSPR
jgi:hypothetical protein